MRDRGTDSAGFSLVEIIVALFVLMAIALALLPALIGATNLSATNRSSVAATTFANGQLAPIRALFPDDPALPTSCAALAGHADTQIDDPADPSTGLQADIVIGTCPGSAYPESISVVVSVYPEGDRSNEITRVATRVMVSGP